MGVPESNSAVFDSRVAGTLWPVGVSRLAMAWAVAGAWLDARGAPGWIWRFTASCSTVAWLQHGVQVVTCVLRFESRLAGAETYR